MTDLLSDEWERGTRFYGADVVEAADYLHSQLIPAPNPRAPTTDWYRRFKERHKLNDIITPGKRPRLVKSPNCIPIKKQA